MLLDRPGSHLMTSSAGFVAELVVAKASARGELTLEQLASVQANELPSLGPGLTKVSPGQIAALLSPRAIEACLREGVNPVGLLKRSLESFAAPGVAAAEQKLRCDMYDELRAESLRAVTLARQNVIDEANEEKAGERKARPSVNVAQVTSPGSPRALARSPSPVRAPPSPEEKVCLQRYKRSSPAHAL